MRRTECRLVGSCEKLIWIGLQCGEAYEDVREQLRQIDASRAGLRQRTLLEPSGRRSPRRAATHSR